MKDTARRINDFSGGQQDYTSPLYYKANESSLVLNCDIQTPGKLQKTKGYSVVGSIGSSGAIKGIGVHEAEDASGTLVKLHKTTLSKWTGSAWSDIDTSFTNNDTDKAEMVNTYLDDEERLYISSGFNDAVGYYNGTAYAEIANTYAKHIEYYKNRLYLANIKLTTTEYPIRFIWSGIGIDTFNTAQDFSDDAGKPITGLKSYGNYLYVFTEDTVSLFNGYTFTSIPGNYGTTDARSLQNVQGRLIWYNRSGVYMYAGEGIPQLISRKIKGWVDLAPTEVKSSIDTDGRYNLYIGDITYKGVAYTDVCLRYDVLNNAWDVLKDRPFANSCVDKASGVNTVYVGSVDDNTVYKLDDTYQANATDILSTYVTPKLFPSEQENEMTFYRVVITYKPQNVSEYVTIKFRLDGTGSFEQIEQTNGNVSLAGTQDVKVQVLDLPEYTNGKNIEFEISHEGVANFEVYDIKCEYKETDL
jgi:hypothetical protein